MYLHNVFIFFWVTFLFYDFTCEVSVVGTSMLIMKNTIKMKFSQLLKKDTVCCSFHIRIEES